MEFRLLDQLRQITNEIPWPIKVIVLIFGFIYYPLGILLTILDGIFHLTSSQQRLEDESPDWIVAKYFGLKGLSKKIHEWIGMLLLIGSVIMIWKMYLSKTNDVEFYSVYMNVFYPIILFMITLAIVLKNVFMHDEMKSSNVAFL